MAKDLTVYLDDSGHPDDQDAVVVAGWVATLEQWLLLEEGWKEVLGEFHIDSRVFHRTDFQAGEGEYKGICCRDKERLLYKLISQINTRVRYGFCTIVPMVDYREANEKFYLEEALGKPYALAGSTVAQRINAWKERFAKQDQVVVILEEGSKHKGDLQDVFIQYGFDRPSFRWKKDVIALQTADLLAWECFHSFKCDKVTRSFQKLLGVPFEHGVLSVADLFFPSVSGVGIPKRDPEKKLKVYFKRVPKKQRIRKIIGPAPEHQPRVSSRAYSHYSTHQSPDDFCRD